MTTGQKFDLTYYQELAEIPPQTIVWMFYREWVVDDPVLLQERSVEGDGGQETSSGR